MNKHKVKRYSIRFALYTILTILAISYLLPYLWMVASSFKTPAMIFDNQFSLIPRNEDGVITFVLDNYKYAFEYLEINKLFINTLIVAVTATALNLFFNSLAGYAFARLKFRGNELIFKIILTSMMIPGTIMLVPNLIIINRMGLYDTLTALVLPFALSVYNVFLMRQTFLSLAVELEEAAIVEGASRFRIFLSIAMPLASPTLIVLGITTFMWNYNNFLWPLVATISDEKKTLALGLGSLIAAGSNNPELYPAMIAGAVIMSVPLIILFITFQRFILKGINIGGVKE